MAKRGKRLLGTEVLKLLESNDSDDQNSSDLDRASDDEPMHADVLVADYPAIHFMDSGHGNQLTDIDPCYRDSLLFDDIELMQVCIVFFASTGRIHGIYIIYQNHREISYNVGNTHLSHLDVSLHFFGHCRR